MGIVTRIRTRLMRLLPDDLRGRLLVMFMALNLAVLVVAFGSMRVLTVEELHRLDRQRGVATLRSFNAFTSVQVQRLGENLESFKLCDELRHRLGAPPGPSGEELRRWLQATTPADAIVWLDTEGRVAYSFGPSQRVRALRELARPRRSFSGVTATPLGATFVVGRPESEVDGRGVGGFVVVSQPLGRAELDRFTAYAGADRVQLGSAAYAGGQTERLRNMGPLRNVSMHEEAERMIVSAEIVGMDGAAAGVLNVFLDDSTHGRARSSSLEAALISAAMAILLGIAASLVTSRIVQRPVEQLVDEIGLAGHRAAEGLGADKVRVNRLLTVEFRRIAETFDGVLGHLGRRQTELRNATRKAQETEAALRTALDSSPEAKLLVRRHRIVLANPAAAAFFGVPPNRLVGLSIEEVGSAVEIYAEDKRVTAFEDLIHLATAPVLLHFVRPDAPERWAMLHALRPEGTSLDVLISARDVTEERRLESLRTEILSLVSHDLRSPLSVIGGYLDLLGRGLDDGRRAQAIDNARKNVQRIDSLIDDIASAMHAEEVFAPKAMLPVQLATLADGVVASIAPTAEHEIVADLHCRPVVLGEEARLGQALTNLIGNAQKYAPASTRITVGVRMANGNAELYVEDQGPGIPEESRDTVFERYIRLHKGDARPPGLGLGLYIVRTITLNHGGTVRVEDVESGGARFVMSLPSVGEADPGNDCGGPEIAEADAPETLDDAG